MKTKEIIVGERKFVIRELRAIDLDDVDWNDRKNAIKKQIILSAGLTDEEYNNLTLKERLILLQGINDLNGLTDFQAGTV